jgi:myo-inositol-1(or 4)-monophosphatase
LPLDPLLTATAVEAALAAGRIQRSFFRHQLTIDKKGPIDLVTAADLAVEQDFRQRIASRFPTHAVLGEEGVATAEPTTSAFRWIVDPLDGTTNFLHGIPQFAISIALERDGVIVAGVIYNPANEELFTAERGKGAFLNDQRLRVAARRRLSDAVVACGLPHMGRGDLGLFRRELALIQDRVVGLRRFGAAALDLAWLAAGRFDVFWERDLSPWDMAAGIIMVREAGGFATDLDGGESLFLKKQIIAGNEFLHKELLQALKEARA